MGADAATAPGASAALPQASPGGWGRARMVGGKPRGPRGAGGPGYPPPSGARGPSGYRPPLFIIMYKLSAGASVAAPSPIIIHYDNIERRAKPLRRYLITRPTLK